MHGFSPYQLAIGYTLEILGVLTSTLPALEEASSSGYIAKVLQTIAAARKSFIQSENSERIKRSLRHNVRQGSGHNFFNGDTVYYKRMDSRRWKGPGTVIGQDSQQVLIKHGSTYVRVHPCRVVLDKYADNIKPLHEVKQARSNNEHTLSKDSSSDTDCERWELSEEAEIEVDSVEESG